MVNPIKFNAITFEQPVISSNVFLCWNYVSLKLLNTWTIKLKLVAGLRTSPVYYKLKYCFMVSLKMSLEESTNKMLPKREIILKKLKNY